MAKKNALNSLRMRKEFTKLAEEGYKFRSDVVVCNKELCNDAFDFGSLSIQKSFLSYPIYRVESYFIGNGKEVVISAEFSSKQGSIRKRELGDAEISTSLKESGELYNLCYGDIVPDIGLYDEPLNSFELLLPTPFFYTLLEECGLLMGNEVLWGIFYNKTYRENCGVAGRQYFRDLSKEYSGEIMQALYSQGYSIKDSRLLSDDRLVVEYHNPQGTVAIKMYMGVGVTMWYVDLYTDEVALDTLMKGTSEQGAKVEDLKYYEIGELATISDINSLKSRFSLSALNSWRYKSIMLNSDVSDALFRCTDLSMKDLLEDLSVDGYVMLSLGVANMISTEAAIVSCGFFNGGSYCYVSFYFDNKYGCFVANIRSFLEEQYMLEVNNSIVFMTGIEFTEENGFITFIQGFDFEEIKAAGLVG